MKLGTDLGLPVTGVHTFPRWQVKLGTDLNLTLGPLGRELSAETRMSLDAIEANLSYLPVFLSGCEPARVCLHVPR